MIPRMFLVISATSDRRKLKNEAPIGKLVRLLPHLNLKGV